MSFWSGLKSAFGFSPDDDSDYIDTEPMDSDAAPLPASSSLAPQHIAMAPSGTGDGWAAAAAEDEALPADLFEAVVAVFNEAQPDFVRRCLSTDAQKKYLIDSLSESLRRRVSAAVSPPREPLVPRPDTKAMDNLRSENSKLRLSLERQKRSMTDRIHNLEANINEIHAAHTRETEALKARFATPEPLPEPLPEPETRQEPEPDYSEWEERVSALQGELNRQTALREQAETKSRIADRMAAEMRNMEARCRDELEQTREALHNAEQEVSRLRAEAEELRVTLEEERRNDYKGRAEKLEAENSGLRKTIETNLYNQANNEMRLRREIKGLKSRIPAETPLIAEEPSRPCEKEPEAEAEAPQKRRRGRPRKVKPDSGLTDAEWFAAGAGAPGDTAKGVRAETKADTDFGYHEPPRKMPNDNAAQLSLF